MIFSIFQYLIQGVPFIRIYPSLFYEVSRLVLSLPNLGRHSVAPCFGGSPPLGFDVAHASIGFGPRAWSLAGMQVNSFIVSFDVALALSIFACGEL